MSRREHPTVEITSNEFVAPGIAAVGDVVRQFSNEHPALVCLGLRNETRQEKTLHTAPPLPFPVFHNDADDRHEMYLITEDEKGFLHNRNDDPIIPNSPDDGCWRIQSTGGHAQTQVGFSLPAGELYEYNYVVLAPANADACLPPGDYNFTGTLDVDSHDNKYDWGLALTVQ